MDIRFTTIREIVNVNIYKFPKMIIVTFLQEYLMKQVFLNHNLQNVFLFNCRWIYTTEKELNSTGYFSLFTQYHDGGFYQDLSRNKSTSVDLINSLFQNSWITLGTRVVFIDFTLYNPNINLFSVIKLYFRIK